MSAQVLYTISAKTKQQQNKIQIKYKTKAINKAVNQNRIRNYQNLNHS